MTSPWPLAVRPGFLIRRLHQLHVALFSAACKDFGLTPVQYSLLSAVASRKVADQSTLALDVALDKTTTAGALRRLERRGLIRRMVMPQDRRSQICAISPAGTLLLRKIEPLARQAHNETLTALNTEEQIQLLNLLSKAISRSHQSEA